MQGNRRYSTLSRRPPAAHAREPFQHRAERDGQALDLVVVGLVELAARDPDRLLLAGVEHDDADCGVAVLEHAGAQGLADVRGEQVGRGRREDAHVADARH
ncbi:hypothetical protein GCM10023334_078720 [Nonomuraea thailandensis]